jgi:hypothetical protein
MNWHRHLPPYSYLGSFGFALGPRCETPELSGKGSSSEEGVYVAGPNHKTWEYPIEAWKQVIEINLFGVFLCCRAMVPQMV